MNYPTQDSTYVERKLQREANSKRMQDAGSKLAMIAIVVFAVAVIVAQIAIHYADAIAFMLGGV